MSRRHVLGRGTTISDANKVEGVQNIQELKPQMAAERSLSPIEPPPERERIFDDLMRRRVKKILGVPEGDAVYYNLESKKEDILIRCKNAFLGDEDFEETEEDKAKYRLTYRLTDDKVSKATQFFIGEEALVINRSYVGKEDNLEDVIEIIADAKIGPEKIITFSYRNSFHLMSVVIDVPNKNINFTDSFEDKESHYFNQFLSASKGLRKVLEEKFGEEFKINRTRVEERVVQDEAIEEKEVDSTTCGVHAILNNSIGVLRAKYGDEVALSMIKIKMNEILGVEVEGGSLEELMLNAKQQCFSSEELKLKMKERAVCAAEISKEIIQSGIYPKSTTAQYLQDVEKKIDEEVIKQCKRDALVAKLQDYITYENHSPQEGEDMWNETDIYDQPVWIALNAFQNLYRVDKVRTIWQEQLKLTSDLEITDLENTKKKFFISKYATTEDFGLGMKVTRILEPFLEADLDDQDNILKAIEALNSWADQHEAGAPDDTSSQQELSLSNLEKHKESQKTASSRKSSSGSSQTPSIILESESRKSSEGSSSLESSSPRNQGVFSRESSEGSSLSSINKKASQAPAKELGTIWKTKDGVTRYNIENPLPSSSVQVVTAVLMKVPAAEKSAFYGKDRGDNYKTIEGAYSENESERAKEVAEIMAFILSKIAYNPLVKRKNGDKDLTKEQLLALIDYAKKNGGVRTRINEGPDADTFGYVEQTDAEIAKALESSGVKVSVEVAKCVSGQYQAQCRLCGILSGNGDSNNGSTLNFLTEQAREIFANAVEINGKIEPKLGENTPQAIKVIRSDRETVGPSALQTVIRDKEAQVRRITTGQSR